MSWGLRWNYLLEARLPSMDPTMTEQSTHSDFMRASRLAILAGERITGVAILPKIGCDSNGPWRRAEFGSDASCWDLC